MIVLVHHALLVSPQLANGYNGSAPSRFLRWPWLLTYTPLHLFWAGGEAVLVFFVLSGLVLALPYASGRTGGWVAYYPQRLLRLYLPITAAAALAFVIVNAVPRHSLHAVSWWLASHVSPVGVHEAMKNAVVVNGTTWMNSAYWSLKWEIYFSLLLPLFVLALVRVRRAALLRAVILFGLVAVGLHSGHQSLLYLPIFGLGVLMAQNLGRLDGLGRGFDTLGRGHRRDIAIGVGLLLVARWWIATLPYSGHTLVVGTLLTVLGACLLVWLFGSTAAGRSVGEHPVPRWLGKRSFSLYLVHEPIVVSVAYLLHATTDPVSVLLISVPLCLVAAEIFGRFIEMPSHRLARSVGRRLQKIGR